MHTIKKALIVGGGIAGPATALALQKAGIESTAFEAYAMPADGVGGVLMIAPNGLSALDLLGVDLDEVGQAIERQVIADANGKTLFEFGGLPGLPPSRLMHRSALYRALVDAMSAAGIPLHSGKRLIGVDETGDALVARFDDGSTASGDVLIGADGIHSTVRSIIDPFAPRPTYVGLLGVGGYSTASVPNASIGTMYFAYGKRAFFGYWNLPAGGAGWFSNLPCEQRLSAVEARRTPATEWLERLRETHVGDVPAALLAEHTAPEQLLIAGASEMLPGIPHWHRGRMVLVGDSAHAPSSSSGQGVSLALESAVQLARCLRDVADVRSAFETYEKLRRPRVERIAAEAARTNSRKAAGPLGKAIMSLLMPVAIKTFMSPQKMFGSTHAYRIQWDQCVTA
jgi:2-polyprenyl-6-methoxyphenol hydroxylase-like FAD-dependent oxidoreductase